MKMLRTIGDVATAAKRHEGVCHVEDRENETIVAFDDRHRDPQDGGVYDCSTLYLLDPFLWGEIKPLAERWGIE